MLDLRVQILDLRFKRGDLGIKGAGTLGDGISFLLQESHKYAGGITEIRAPTSAPRSASPPEQPARSAPNQVCKAPERNALGSRPRSSQSSLFVQQRRHGRLQA